MADDGSVRSHRAGVKRGRNACLTSRRTTSVVLCVCCLLACLLSRFCANASPWLLRDLCLSFGASASLACIPLYVDRWQRIEEAEQIERLLAYKGWLIAYAASRACAGLTIAAALASRLPAGAWLVVVYSAVMLLLDAWLTVSCSPRFKQPAHVVALLILVVGVHAGRHVS